MSGTLPANEPNGLHAESASVELVIDGRPRDLGGFAVRRLLPSASRRLVGPFIFFDHMGPAALAPGVGFNVRPHPHIGLATVTYLFDGEIVHRDSLGSVQPIRPGDVNWMLAGRGIAHSERTSTQAQRTGIGIHGIQSWVALPLEHEEMLPRFEHHTSGSIPTVERAGARLDVIAGTAFGARSPVGCVSPTLYVHARLDAGARLAVDTDHEERAVYIVEGATSCEARRFGAGSMVIFRPGAPVNVEALEPTRMMLLGGAKLAGERQVWWNFVASSKERIERAKDDWKNRRFPTIPGDDIDFIPLPSV